MAQTSRIDQPNHPEKQESSAQSSSSDDKSNAQPPGPNSSSSKLAKLAPLEIVKPTTKVQTIVNAATSPKSGSAIEETEVCSVLTPLGKPFQPSKLFISKCQSEIDALLEAIKDSFHEDIKSLFTEELYADLTVNIGENFKKSLHKCLLASRTFKFYTALKPFWRQENPLEEDIIISEFQNLKDEDQQTPVKILEEKTDQDNEATKKAEDEEAAKEPVFVTCDLPDDLINPELFTNFVRRAYLNTDLAEEDFKLNQQLVAWLKVHKPETIRPPRVSANCSPDHRESFRTIVPNFDELPCTPSPAMSREQHKLTPSMDDTDEISLNNSSKDESFTGSQLTRTETFELIRSNPDSPRVCSPSKTPTIDNDDELDSKVTEQDEKKEPYAPTTRTGLKPKKFTTPKDLPQSNRTPLKPKAREDLVKSRTSTPSTTQVARNPTTPSTKQQTPSTASKRLSQGSTTSEATSETKAPSSTASKASSTKTKTTHITRAYPISMERSQSPGTNLLRSSGRNFIAANKRMVAKTDKKTTQLQSDTTGTEAEIETIETAPSSFIFEPVNTDNLAAQLDKLTLVSQSNLADCLSRLFINESLSDVVIKTSHNKRINAHKCILAARSAYLADLFSKQDKLAQDTTAEKPSQTADVLEIDLTEYSYPAIYFACLHIYSGIVKVPDDLDLSELAGLNHLLHVNTLRQVCIHNLRMNYCHFFHKPCNVCCLGVLKTLPLAWRYDYQELYSKCLQWVGSHFASIFCLKEFADLKPNDLLEECYKATLSQLTPDNIIPKTIECQKLLKNLPRVKWTEPIICLVGRLLEDFCHYVADNYEKIIQSETFLNLSKNCWECEVLEENLLAAMNHLKPDSGCKTLIQLHKIECSNESFGDDRVSDSYANLVTKMRKYCERYLLKEATAVVHCSSWRHMSPSLQKRIKDQAIIATDFDEPTKQLASKPKLPSMARNTRQQMSSSPGGNNGALSDSGSKSPSNRSTPDSRLKSPNAYLPPPKNKTPAARHVKVLK